jgi:hypothetical protein
VVDPKAALARDRLGEWRNRLFVEVFDRPARGANQVMMMAGLAPDIGGDVTGSLEPLGQPGAYQGVERAKHRRAADVGMLPAHPLVQLLSGGFFPGLRQHRGDGESLGCQPDASLL